MRNIRVESRNAICHVTIDRPGARNAVDGATARELADAFRAFEEDETLKVAILSGAGNAFCAGADLKAIASGDPLRANRLEPAGDGPMGPTRLKLSKPVIAAISGYCVAGGLELACWCDLRVADETAIFGVFCRRFGVPLIDGGTVRLPRLIGQSRAMDMILTGRPVDAQEALAFGLANRVVPAGEHVKAAEALARDLCAVPQVCMRHDHLSAIEQWGMPIDEAILNEFTHGANALRCRETFEGAARFAGGEGRHGAPKKG
jgi:enoyl-CoA hydratase